MSFDIEFRSDIDRAVKWWKEADDRIKMSMGELMEGLADIGVEELKRFLSPFILTGKLVDSIKKGVGGRAGISGMRGYFATQKIEVSAPHATFVDKGTDPSPGRYFWWINPTMQSSEQGGRISKDNPDRKDTMHRGTPARRYSDYLIRYLEKVLYGQVDEHYKWLFR